MRKTFFNTVIDGSLRIICPSATKLEASRPKAAVPLRENQRRHNGKRRSGTIGDTTEATGKFFECYRNTKPTSRHSCTSAVLAMACGSRCPVTLTLCNNRIWSPILTTPGTFTYVKRSSEILRRRLRRLS